MRRRLNKTEQKKIILQFIKKNPKATYKDIRKKTKLHPERIFKNLKEAFKEARIDPPRTLDFKTRDERRKIIIDYIKKHPNAGGQVIARDTKINLSTAFKNIENAFNVAEIKYPRKIDKRTKEEKKQTIIQIVKKNSLITIPELMKKSKSNPYRFFRNIKEIYREAGVKSVKREEKWKLKKREEIINFIKNNPLATQREINKTCKTHVQELFSKGIFEAYKKANVKFPFERLRLYGIGLEEVRHRAKTFEDEISIKLSGYGKVNRIVKTKRGFADIILERKGKKAIIEIKDYQNKDISTSQIQQLNKYLDDCECNLGFLICHKKPRKDKFLMGKNKIYVLEKEELEKLPNLIDGLVAK